MIFKHRIAGRRDAGCAAATLVVALSFSASIAADETYGITHPAAGSVAPYVPTVEEDVELMLDVAGVGPGDYVIDLGAGDGRIVLGAARRGALAHGVEIEPELVELARRNAERAGVAERATFVEGDIFTADIADASVVTLYLFPEANIELRPKLLADLAPGTRVVSNSFDMGEWRPDVHDTSARTSGGILLWIVPARVGGEWTIEIAGDASAEGEDTVAPARHRLSIEQTYQHIDIALAQMAAAESVPPPQIAEATLRGDRILFRAVGGGRSYAFGGRVDGDAMSGYVQIRDGAETLLRRWSAVR